jgi:hypothetical protein
MGERMWHAPSVRMIRRLFPMYPLTVEGVDALTCELV